MSAEVNKTLVRLTYRLADQVIAVSEGVKDELITKFGVREAKVRVIYNPIDTAQICERASEAPSINLPKPYILGMGRLVPNKNFRLLIDLICRRVLARIWSFSVRVASAATLRHSYLSSG